MEPLNRLATELVDEAIDFAEELTIDVRPLSGDAAVLDFGVDVPGGIEAGLLLTEIQTAGLATVQTRVDEVGGTPLPHVELATDHPVLALLCAGKAGWELSLEGFEGLGSGPARALVATEDIFERVGYAEEFEMAVLAVETETLPDERVAAAVAERAGVPESGVFLPAYRTASVTGSVASAARAGELATYRLAELGYDPRAILSVTGSAPVPPVADREDTAMARSMDALAYGGQVHLVVETEFDRFDAVASNAGDAYDEPFAAIFADVDWEFGELPVELFGPAQVTIDVVGGETYVYGDTDEALVTAGFGL